MRQFALTLATCLLSFGANAQDQIDVKSRATVFTGPYEAEIVRVIDGDTVEVSVALWPGLRAEYYVRVSGIDAPELHRPDCAAEEQWTLEAKEQAEKLYPVGQIVQLRDVSYDAFAGRVVADVRRWRSDRWLPFALEMVERELAVEWQPGQDPVPWCLLGSGD